MPRAQLLPWKIKGLNHGADLALCAAQPWGQGWVGLCQEKPLVREGGVAVGPQGHRLEEFYFKWLPDACGLGGPSRGERGTHGLGNWWGVTV